MNSSSMAKQGGKGLVVKIVFAVIGAISGVSIFVSFIAFRNVNAAIWGLLSALFAILGLRLHLAYRKNKLHLRFTPGSLRAQMHFGAFGSFASLLASVVYFSLAISLKQGYKLEDDGYMPAAIFSLLNLKWTTFLCWHSNKYGKILTSDKETSPIVANGDNVV